MKKKTVAVAFPAKLSPYEAAFIASEVREAIRAALKPAAKKWPQKKKTECLQKLATGMNLLLSTGWIATPRPAFVHGIFDELLAEAEGRAPGRKVRL